MYTVTILNENADIELTQFLDKLSLSENAVLGYHYPFYGKMLKSIEIGEPFYLGLYDKNELVAFLPGFVKNEKQGNVYSSLPFFGPNAGILCQTQNKIIYSNALLAFLENYLAQNNFISASIYSSFLAEQASEDKLFEDFATTKIEKFTSYIALEKLSISTKIAYDIRKAEKEGVLVSREITDFKVSELYKIYHQNCIDFDIPIKPQKCIQFLAHEATKSDAVTFYFAELEGQIIGALIMIWSKAVASYYLPCSLNEFRTYQSNTLLINTALEEAKNRNIKIWNWESSPSVASGVYKFKKKWGSEDTTYNIFLKLLENEDFFVKLGKENISKLYPNFFVFPFNKL